MPTYQLTSPKTGRVYNVDATAELPDDDIDALVSDLDFEAARAAGVQPGVDPFVLKQGPLGTFAQSFPNAFAKVGSSAIGFVGRQMDNASEALSQATGLPKGGDMFQRVADYSDELVSSADITFPVNPLNPVAGALGSGAAQGLSLLAGGAATKAITGSTALATAAPLVSGFMAGGNEGMKTAEEIGVKTPLGRMALGATFGGLEMFIEKMGGMGSKAAKEMMEQAVRKSAAEIGKQAGKSVVSEMVEEPLTGAAQAAAARLAASEDPNNPGYTTTGVKLSDLFDEIVNLEKRKLEALGGAAGGTVFAGVQALANRQLPNDPTTSPNQTPTSPQPPAPGQPGAAAPMGAGAPGPAAVSPLIGIAQRGGAVDVTLPEDTGELTAEEVQDLETGRLGDLETGRRQPILQGVPDRPQQATPFRESSINEEPIMEGDAITDLRIPRSPQAIAESQRIEAERQQKIATMRMLDARAQGMPLIPDSPSGSRDILDFANENPIYLPPGFSEERNLPEYEKLKEAKLPPYWRQFVASSKRGGNPSDVAQRAFDAGFIDAPTADAYLEAVRGGIEGRQQYRVQFKQREQALAEEETRVVDFEKTQDKLARKRKEPATEVSFEDIVPGDEMTIDGEAAVVRNVEYNEDGYLTNVVIEDGKRFGLMQFDPQTRGGILVDEYLPRAARPAVAADEFAPEDAPSPSLPVSLSPSLDSLLQGTESTRPRNRGETTRPQNADPLGELQRAKLAGEANQAQGQFTSVTQGPAPTANKTAQQAGDAGLSPAAGTIQLSRTLSRQRPKNQIVFDTPISTPAGLIRSYSWASKIEEIQDKTGEVVEKRFSDWDMAVTNAETGRDIVHQFDIEKPDGTITAVSLESALGKLAPEVRKNTQAVIRAARRLPLRQAEFQQLQSQLAAYEAALRTAQQSGWQNAPEPRLETPEFPPLAERGVKAIYVGKEFIKNLEQSELKQFNDPRQVVEWKRQWAVSQVPRLPYGTRDRIDVLKRGIRKDMALLPAAGAINLSRIQPPVASGSASASTPESATPESDLTPGFQHLVIDRDLEAGFMSGAGADALIDLAHRAFAAGRTFAQWAAAMVQRFGAAVRDYLAAVWDHAKRSSQTGALNFTSRLGEQLQQSQQAASRLRNPASRATPAAMASDPGAAQNAEPSPGGLSEAEARNPMTIYRAGDADEVGVKPWASFTPERKTAEAYTDNPGFGGDTVRELQIDAGNVLDLTSGNKFRKLAQALGFEGDEAIDKAEEWRSNGWNYPWEESSKVKRALQESEFDAVQYTDDFPEGATTIIFTRKPQPISKPSFESSRAAAGTSPRLPVSPSPRLEPPASRATTAAMASDPGAAQNAKFSPGGLSEADGFVSERMLYGRGSDKAVVLYHGGPKVEKWQTNKERLEQNAFAGFHLTENEDMAARYAANSTDAKNAVVTPYYARIPKVWDTRWQKGKPPSIESLLDWQTFPEVEGDKFRLPLYEDDYMEAAASGYDGVISDTFLGDVTGDYGGLQIVVFDPQKNIIQVNPESSRAAAGTSPRLPVSPSPRLEPPAATAAPLKAAYASALRGSSTAMVPLADVFAAAQAANPALTQEQFQAQVMADYEAGSLMLEGAGGPQEAQSAALRIDGTPVGTAVRMMVPQGFTHLDVSGQRSQAGFVINPLPALQRLAARVLPLHERGEPFRVQQLGARAILTGSPLPSDVTQVLAMTENERQAVAQSAAQVGRDLQAAVKAYLDRTGQDERATWDKINAVMEGQPGALTLLTAIDPALGERSRRARNMLDDLSAAVAQTLPTGSLRDAITQNQGSWMRRGYAAFDPESGWNFDGLTKAAKAGRQIGGKDAAKILANARAYLRSQNPQNGRTLKEWNADIEADMRDLMDRNAWQSANLGGNTLRKNVSSFMRRKEIAPEIRALMGEETNPLHRFIKSAAFQAQIVARHHGQTAVRALGLQTELFSTQRGGVYTEEIEPSENRWSGLAGVWTTPEMKAALANSSAVNREGTDLGGWLVGTVKALGNEAKLNRVALNPDSWVVNILGNVVGLVQSGDVFAWDFARRLTDARALIKSGKARPGSMQTAAESALIDAQRAMLARLRGMGVIGSSITLADIEASIPRHLLQWVAEDRARNTGLGAVKGAIMGQAAGRGLGLPGRVVGGVAGGIGGAIAGAQRLQNWQQNVADYVMTGPDALARVTGWLTNYETALAAGQNPDQAAADATTRTLNTFPNYNALPALLRQLSRLGFTGSFIAFQWEVYRNFGWNVKYAIEELSSGNAAIQARGLRRLAGIGSVAALAGGGLAALLGAAGAAASDDEERNKIWRQWFAAPWEKDAVLAFDKYDKQGVSYYNTSYLLPQMTMMELIQGASEGRDPADSASRVLNRLSEQFIAGSVHLQPLLSAFANQDRFGRRITNAEGLAGAAARVDVAAQTILEPGFADKITRLTYALRQAEKNGRKFSVEEEMKRLAGIRQVSRTWEELVKRRYSQFTYDYQGVRDDANKILGENLPGAPVRAVKMVNDKVIELEQQLADYERDLRRLGVPEPTIKAAKKDSNLQRLNPVRVRADGRRVEAVTVR